MNLDIAFYTFSLSQVRGVGSVIGKRLIDFFGSARGVFEADKVKIEQVAGKFVAENIKRFSGWKNAEETINLALRLGQGVICYEEQDSYPELLRRISDPPLCIFYRGNVIKDMLCVAVVGTRMPSSYGVDVTKNIVSVMASVGICIVSGLALGIDTISHKAAIDAGGRTYAILASSCDNIYPYRNEQLAKEIVDKGGAIISEFPPGTPPAEQNFPRRNRIIAGISKAIVVTEAPEKSGALITAYLGLEYGRDVFAVPGNITSQKSKGTNRLIKEGAYLVESPDDIMSVVVPHIARSEKRSDFGLISPYIEIKNPNLSDKEEAILSVLSEEIPIHVDDIIKRTLIDPSEVLSTLIALEIKGLVVEDGIGYYRKPRPL